MRIDLDTRMRMAGESLRRASERLSPDTPPRRDPRRVVLVAVVILVMAAGGVVLARDDDNRRADVATDPSGVPRLVPDHVPAGLAPTGAIDLPVAEDGRALGSMPITVYGDPDAEDPFAAVDLGIRVVELEGESARTTVTAPDRDGGARLVMVRGRQGLVESEPSGVTLAWQEEAGTQISLASSTLDQDQLLAIAEELAIDGLDVTLGSVPPDLPGELAPVGTLSDLFVSTAVPLPASARGHLVGYQSEDSEQLVIAATFIGDASELAVIRWLSHANDPVEVRGRPGWIGASDVEASAADIASSASGAVSNSEPGRGSTTHTLVWEEAPAVLAIVQAFGIDETELRAVAASLRPATDPEWGALLAATAPDDDSASALALPEDGVVQLQGEYSGGRWAVYTDAQDQLCGAVASSGSGIGVCGGEDERIVTIEGNEGTPVLVFGVMPQGATDLRIRGSTGTTATDGHDYYALAIDTWSAPTELTFIDAEDQIVETVSVSP